MKTKLKSSSAIVHEQPEDVPGTFQCELCDHNVDTEVEIRKHMDVHHGKNECNVCKISYWHIEDYNNHMKSCHVIISIKCKECDFTSNKMSGLIKHKSDNHNIKCDQCEWRVSTSKDMENHKQQVHGNNKQTTQLMIKMKKKSLKLQLQIPLPMMILNKKLKN